MLERKLEAAGREADKRTLLRQVAVAAGYGFEFGTDITLATDAPAQAAVARRLASLVEAEAARGFVNEEERVMLQRALAPLIDNGGR